MNGQATEELFDMAVYIYAATHKPDQIDFDFCLVHLLTGMDAIRKVKPYLHNRTIKKLLCCLFYSAISIYICQRQPEINERLIDNWEYIIDQTLHTKLATEVHCVKVIRSLRDAEILYEPKEGLYLKAALKSVDHLNVESPYNYYKSHEPWIGIDDVDRELNVKH